MRTSENTQGWEVNTTTTYPKGQGESNPFGNPFYGYRKVELTLPGDTPATFFGILVGPCVHSVVFDEDDRTYLVRQHRPNAMQPGELVVPTTWELPGGFVKDPNDIEASVCAELEEEARGRGLAVKQIGRPYTAPGASDEIDHIFMVEGFSSLANAQDSGEATEADMRVFAAPFDTVYDLAMSGELPTSSQTLAGLALAAYNR